MIRIASILALTFLTVFPARAGVERAENQADLVRRTLASGTFRKSGTPEIVELLTGGSVEGNEFTAAYKTLARQKMQKYIDSAHFRVHYDTTGYHAPDLTDANLNGIPDYVDSTLVYLEHAWNVIIDGLGYERPVSDGSAGGNGLTDCYIMEISAQSIYGYSSPDSNSQPTPAYIVIDNNFVESVYPTKSYDALKITTAHEFFHVIHYHYYGGSDAIWWMEQTAVWMEEHIWPDINDYLHYIWLLFQNRNTSIDSGSGTFMYGASLFAMHVAYHYGDGYIRQAWNQFRSSRSGRIENFNSVFPKGVAGALSDFAVWLYFTDYRAPQDNAFFPDAYLIRNIMPMDKRVLGANAVDSLSFKQYTFKYVSIEPEQGYSKGDSLFINLTDRDNGTWRNQVILYDSPSDYEIISLNGLNAAIEFPRDFNRAVLVISNASQFNTNFRMVYSISRKECLGVEDEPAPALFALNNNYPNPFNAATTIPFTIGSAGRVTLRVMNLQGQTVDILEDRWFEPGDYQTTWSPSGIASGMYFIVLESGMIRRSQRMVYAK